ncbi:hypothetical protein [Amycolatopsis sp. NPDC059021]|uniref:hypothetical protein n=1 Tax=Amycolatopsis sp. NPDC059021 TaxID=3346704 RepID=UPI003671921C
MTKVLIAPVTITPTKALTPSHLKGLLWVDVMYRATSLVADVTYRYSNTTYNVTAQTLGYWEFLDRTFGDIDYSAHSELRLGELYVRYHRERRRVPFGALEAYSRAVEATGWVHPASARLLTIWQDYFARLGMHDPGLTAVQPPGLGLEEMIEHLAGRDLCLDTRATGGPVYLDVTRFGVPLRQIVTAEDQPNYLAGALRELVPLAPLFDEVVLAHDRELTEDYVALQRLLGALGARVVRVVVDRVPIDGVVRSSRHGGWEEHTPSALFDLFPGAGPEVLRLGMRLYFVAVLGKGSGQSFRADLLANSLSRAAKLLASPSRRHTPGEIAEYVGRHRGAHRHVDAYRLTSSLLSRHREPPVAELARQVYC